MRRARALGAGLLVLALADAAAGHSVVLESFPADGARVAAPARLIVRFNNRIEKALSRLRLLDARGRPFPLGGPAADGPPDRLSAALPPLAAGTYRVEWRVLSTDGHTVSGRFSFRVVP